MFDSHPEMALRADDIAVFIANWEDKSLNLVRIAKQLNIGLDSLVFIDDNPVERARIRESLPEVTVPELPGDPAGYVQAIVDGAYFEAASFTPEDLERSAQYVANAKRGALQDGAQSLEQFLAGLEMSMDFGRAGGAELARVVQLLNKTNQFNVTGRRFTSEEVAGYVADQQREVLYFRLSDRFGDNGLVSVVLGSVSSESDTFVLDNWVMSCRVFGREFEHEILNVLVEIARARGARFIEANFIPTAKNGVIRTLFETLGFTSIERSESGGQRWRLSLDGFRSLVSRISRGAPN